MHRAGLRRSNAHTRLQLGVGSEFRSATQPLDWSCFSGANARRRLTLCIANRAMQARKHYDRFSTVPVLNIRGEALGAVESETSEADEDADDDDSDDGF